MEGERTEEKRISPFTSLIGKFARAFPGRRVDVEQTTTSTDQESTGITAPGGSPEDQQTT